ncbi:hypothetical protein [Brucella anthropi]
MKKNTLSLIAAGVGASAIAGFGFSAGRDVYKSTKKAGGGLLLILAVIFCPFIGARGLVRGHDRGFFGTLFLTFIVSLLLIAIGFAAATFISWYILILSSPEGSEGSAILMSAVLIGATVTAVIGGIGLLIGLIQRPKRLKVFEVERYNKRFMYDAGFQETDGSDITHYDPDGQPLRFLEAHPGKLSFMAVGRRGKRAFINLDDDGRMVSYNGIV